MSDKNAPAAPLDPAILAELAGFTTPSVANGVETFNVRPRDEGFMDGTVRCIFPNLPTMVGYAVTARIHAASQGDRVAPAELWKHAVSMPTPRIVVIEDLDDPPGVGSFWGEVNANVFRALGCIGVVTNGGVRDLREMEALGFHAFAGSICVSHAYVRVVEVGIPVKVGGLTVRPGELLHGDRHGVMNVPVEIARELPAAIRGVEADERVLIGYCQSREFNLDGLIALRSQPGGVRR
ncbi:MAG TPA: RraA family protein [Candidatus Binataceae bacterium]|nr:RraA family protein [Candidatus Binataceae bacterium]